MKSDAKMNGLNVLLLHATIHPKKTKSNPEKKLGIGSPVFCTFLFAP